MTERSDTADINRAIRNAIGSALSDPGAPVGDKYEPPQRRPWRCPVCRRPNLLSELVTPDGTHLRCTGRTSWADYD